MRLVCLQLWILGCLFAFPATASASLSSGTGEFSFTSPGSGKTLRVYYVKAEGYDPVDPPILVLHGQGRNADEYRDGWIALAEKNHFFVVAPEFTREDFPGSRSYNLGNLFDSESDLTPHPENQWSFHLPVELFTFLHSSRETTAEGYYAFGHSAGGQFLHRSMALVPDARLLLGIAANSGWYTLPNRELSWPYGYKGTPLTEVSLRAYLAAPLLLLLGDQDIDPEGPGLRRTPQALEQGPHRFARGHTFFEQGRAQSAALKTPFHWHLQVVPGVAHDGRLMAPAAAEVFAEATAARHQAKTRWAQWLALLVIAGTVWFVLRQYQTHATLLLAGFALLTLAFVSSRLANVPLRTWETSPTGWFGFDLFALVKQSFATRAGRIGLIVMAAGGFARYMSSIAASTALVNLAVRPLLRLRRPYLLLALAYVFGQILNIFVPSAAGLAMLLLVALFPTLVKLGLPPISVAAVIGTTACLDLGPASAASNVAAKVAGLEPAVYFVRHQLPVAAVVIPVIAVLHAFWQRYLDRREAAQDNTTQPLSTLAEVKETPAPAVYALLPLIPLVLLVVFSPLVVRSIQLDVVTAMLLGLFVGILCEAIRHRNLKKALEGIVVFFQGMGDLFAKVVTLIVAAEVFATGVKATGLIDTLIELVQGSGLGHVTMGIALVALIGFTAIVTGSGNAALFSFANLIPGIARSMGVENLALMLPSQLAAGLFRSLSPVAGVIIAVASTAQVSPFAIIRRTAVPMLGGTVMMFWIHQILS